MENQEQTWHLPHAPSVFPPRGRCMAGTVVIESWGGSSLSPEMVMDGPKVRWENKKRYLGGISVIFADLCSFMLWMIFL